MRIPNHLEDLARQFPTIEPLDRYIREQYKRFADMTFDEVRELLWYGELYKLYRARERKTREAKELREAALSPEDRRLLIWALRVTRREAVTPEEREKCRRLLEQQAQLDG